MPEDWPVARKAYMKTIELPIVETNNQLFTQIVDEISALVKKSLKPETCYEGNVAGKLVGISYDYMKDPKNKILLDSALNEMLIVALHKKFDIDF